MISSLITILNLQQKKILISLFLFAIPFLYSQNNFDKEWQEIYKYELDGKIQSAFENVQKIYQKAKKKNNETQIIKSFFYISKFSQELEEEAQTKIITNLNNEINEAEDSSPSKAILHYIYASILTDYLHQNSYKINQRTALETDNEANFLLWNITKLKIEIEKNYLSSLINTPFLQNQSILEYKDIFIISPDIDGKNYTLYDFLWNQSFEYFKSNYNTWDLKDGTLEDLFIEDLYSETNRFIELPTKSINNIYFKTSIELLQKYERYYFDVNKNKADEAYLKRLNHIHSLFQNNISYIKSLQYIELTTKNVFLKQQTKIDKAKYLYSITNKKSEKDYYEDILMICDSIFKYKSNKNALAEAEALKNKILKKSLNIQIKSLLYEKENSRAFLTYKNIDSITIHYFKIPKEFNLEKNNKHNDSIVYDFISKNKAITSFKRALPNPKKYFQHTSEITLEPMLIGDYLLIIQPNNQKLEKDTYEFTRISVTNISFIKDSDKNYDFFYVTDRNTGKPLQNIVVKNNEETKKTDVLGKVSFKKKKYKKDNSQTPFSRIYFINKTDTLVSSYNKGWFYPENKTNDNYEEEDFEAKAKVFFDRAIYRPGQKVYYKGIVIQNKENKKSVVPFVTVLVTILDSEHNTLKEYEAQTNEFGSFTGEFDIPKKVLTGEFTLTIEEPDNYENDKQYYNKKEDEHSFWDIVDFNYNNEFHFQVEEYKRPSFEVTFENIKENYTIGDTLKIVGNAKSLAGNNLTNATVNYTINKNVYTEGYNSNSQRKTKIGKVETNAKGDFIIALIANDSLLSNDKIETIIYTIDVEVADTNGETRTASKKIVIGKKVLSLKLKVDNAILYNDDENTLQISTTTLNDYPIVAKGSISISYLEKKKFLKNRQFSIPEIQTIDEKDFRLLFPHEPYNNQDSEVKEIVIKTIPFDTEKGDIIPLDFLKDLEKGNYKIVAKATDANGNEITNSLHFSLKSKKNNFDETVLFTFKDISNPQNDYFEFEFESIVPDLYVFSRFYIGKEANQEHIIQLKNNKGVLKIKKNNPTIHNDFYFHFSSHYDNENFENNYSISKELLLDKKLEFEIISLRNKIEPGSKETWSFKILEQKLETEVLASMYDSSLDQFLQKDWDTNIHFETHYNHPNYPSFHENKKQNINFNKFQQTYSFLNYYIKNPELNRFGFHFTNPNNKFIKEKYLKSIESFTNIPKNAKLVSGTISDNFGPLPGANIVVQGTKRGTTSDFDGNFKIEAEPHEILTISYIGMIDFYYTVKNKNNFISITLEEDSTALDGVLVSGYQAIKQKASLSYSTVIVEDSIPNIPLINYLSGQVSGISITGASGANQSIIIRGISSVNSNTEALLIVDGVPMKMEDFKKLKTSDIESYSILKETSAMALYGNLASGGAIIVTTKQALKEVAQVKTRTNFNETAFFYPQLKTDKEGKLNFSFTTPESLTRWKLRLLGHNKNFENAYFQSDIISQKDLMVIANLPRFVREKDTLTIVSKVVNMTNETKTGIAILLLSDAITGKPIDSISSNLKNKRDFICKPKESTTVSWTINIPEHLQGLQYKIIAKSGNFSDGEENILPVLSNKILITETIPLWIRENSKKEYTLENLKNNNSVSLKSHSYTLEYTSNPVWFAIQSLPYLIEFEHECAEQTFARYYANTLATEILTKNPKIATLFESYRNDKSVKSKLEVNAELKSILLNETPWFFDSENDATKNKQLAYLFETVTLKDNQARTFKKLEEKQLPSGAFSWFDGGNENIFITQHILAGIGHLNNLVPENNNNLKYNTIISKAIPFLDKNFIEQYEKNETLLKNDSYENIHYLYMRSFFLDEYPTNSKLKSILNVQLETLKKNWLAYSLYQKGQLALIFNRFGDIEMAKKVITHLKESASLNDEIGMYWQTNIKSWYWYQSPIETQALLIEAFNEVSQDVKSIDLMKVWLIKNKQNKNWNTTKATSEAIYALILQGSNWSSIKDKTVFKIGNNRIVSQKLTEKEAETGYIKLNWKGNEISKEMASITIENKSDSPSYGGIYWQYFENLETIKESSTSTLKVSKTLFKKEKTTNGTILKPIEKENLKVSDIITIRLILKVSEDIEFVHLKDLRASCFEPIDVISKQQRKDNLYFYQSTKDVATHFFFDKITKGTYILEYDVKINNAGHFNDGIATLQSMYAPEFSTHSKSTMINIKN